MTSAVTILAVMRSGGGYTSEWVRKLRDAVDRNLSIPHRFECLSDEDVPSRIPLKHNWVGWWSKIEIFRKGVITGPTLYIDIDSIITGTLDHLTTLDQDFLVLQSFHRPDFINSSIMWFRDETCVPHKIYDKFSVMPEAYMNHYNLRKQGAYLGDQAFLFDTLGDKLKSFSDPSIKSYKYHCSKVLPENTSIVIFHGLPKPHQVKADWIDKHWI